MGKLARFTDTAGRVFRQGLTASAAKAGASFAEGLAYGLEVGPSIQAPPAASGGAAPNPLRAEFEAIEEGPGCWKWDHYFELYHRHFAKFVGASPRVMEVGVYSGGSLGMWRRYFGAGSMVYGVDIEPACRSYAGEGVEIIIGDQGDAAFWANVRREVEPLDAFIDDGSHLPDHQVLTLCEMFGHLRPGGVYVCEDLHGFPNRVVAFVAGLSAVMASGKALARLVGGVHVYPSMVVLERAATDPWPLTSVRRGTQWEPFLDEGQAKGFDFT